MADTPTYLIERARIAARGLDEAQILKLVEYLLWIAYFRNERGSGAAAATGSAGSATTSASSTG